MKKGKVFDETKVDNSTVLIVDVGTAGDNGYFFNHMEVGFDEEVEFRPLSF